MGVEEIKLPPGTFLDKSRPHAGFTRIFGFAGTGERLVRHASRPENPCRKGVEELRFVRDGDIVGNALPGVGIEDPDVFFPTFGHKAADIEVPFYTPDTVADLLYA